LQWRDTYHQKSFTESKEAVIQRLVDKHSKKAVLAHWKKALATKLQHRRQKQCADAFLAGILITHAQGLLKFWKQRAEERRVLRAKLGAFVPKINGRLALVYLSRWRTALEGMRSPGVVSEFDQSNETDVTGLIDNEHAIAARPSPSASAALFDMINVIPDQVTGDYASTRGDVLPLPVGSCPVHRRSFDATAQGPTPMLVPNSATVSTSDRKRAVLAPSKAANVNPATQSKTTVGHTKSVKPSVPGTSVGLSGKRPLSTPLNYNTKTLATQRPTLSTDRVSPPSLPVASKIQAKASTAGASSRDKTSGPPSDRPASAPVTHIHGNYSCLFAYVGPKPLPGSRIANAAPRDSEPIALTPPFQTDPSYDPFQGTRRRSLIKRATVPSSPEYTLESFLRGDHLRPRSCSCSSAGQRTRGRSVAASAALARGAPVRAKSQTGSTAPLRASSRPSAGRSRVDAVSTDPTAMVSATASEFAYPKASV
jgi:hypothetical protein